MASLTWIIKSPFVLLALGLWILACPASWAEDDDPKALNQQANELIEQGKYQEAIPIAETAVEVAKRVRGPEDPETAEALNNLGLLFKKIGDYVKAEPLYQEALRIREKVLGPEHPDTAEEGRWFLLIGAGRREMPSRTNTGHRSSLSPWTVHWCHVHP